ncbi:UNVERIFIED_CONTAM: hypothetical protein Slati_2373000 [Sesamum latifolium]|uniref:Uncharacterized protein n=1 Tax=Sesamum latifolium TaxID=2727402 RepID=A0AAW2WFH0_9LAMI
MLTNCVLKYYYHGFKTYAQQFSAAGYLSVGMVASFMDEDVGLANALQPDVEVPFEVQENPLLAGQDP